MRTDSQHLHEWRPCGERCLHLRGALPEATMRGKATKLISLGSVGTFRISRSVDRG